MRHKVKQQWSQVWIGNVLRGYGANAGAGVGQRAPTAMDEVVMATPKAPDLAQRPAMEKVIASIRNNCRDFDFHDPFGTGQRRDDQTG